MQWAAVIATEDGGCTWTWKAEQIPGRGGST
jgi:hypothetical protein